MRAVQRLRESEEAMPLAKVLQNCDDRMALVGHSLGAASALRYLRTLKEQDQACPFQAALFMDLWPVPRPLGPT